MFFLTIFKDTMKIDPHNFRKEKHEALADEINKKYANKIVQDVGLCICLHDILEASEGYIHHGDGASYVKVKFGMVVFRPFIGEVMTGRIKSCTQSGVRVSLGFFDDIIIPPALLQENSEFEPGEQVWVWRYQDNDMYMDVDEPIRFRVISEIFTDTTPSSAPKSRLPGQPAGDVEIGNSAKVPPYSLTCTIQEDGLGLLSWWAG